MRPTTRTTTARGGRPRGCCSPETVCASNVAATDGAVAALPLATISLWHRDSVGDLALRVFLEHLSACVEEVDVRQRLGDRQPPFEAGQIVPCAATAPAHARRNRIAAHRAIWL